ncbi:MULTISPECIES: hypothetical protein [unclassified Streptomyces]|uniref:hypothetical protein n=1 Tax=unclassified Streptomyces TaxID=2593676 RepID=UPI002784605C|nr:hypothetical protein [Streptomyces sp. V1I6]MDQ0840893.1 hypothetical protein [Streptomyces sp. V1I6]
MNSAQESATSVVVTLSGCSREDADAVFRALSRSFESDRAADDTPQYVSEGHATVWTATFDVAATRDPAEPVRLAAPVTAELQGGYWAVDQMQVALAAAFDLVEEGMAAGDQEKDVQLLLNSGVHQEEI